MRLANRGTKQIKLRPVSVEQEPMSKIKQMQKVKTQNLASKL